MVMLKYFTLYGTSKLHLFVKYVFDWITIDTDVLVGIYQRFDKY